MEINMAIIYRIVGLSGLMAFLFAAGSIYDQIVNQKDEEKNIAKIALDIIVNMVKIVIVFSIVCTAIIFLFLKPIILLLS